MDIVGDPSSGGLIGGEAGGGGPIGGVAVGDGPRGVSQDAISNSPSPSGQQRDGRVVAWGAAARRPLRCREERVGDEVERPASSARSVERSAAAAAAIRDPASLAHKNDPLALSGACHYRSSILLSRF